MFADMNDADTPASHATGESASTWRIPPAVIAGTLLCIALLVTHALLLVTSTMGAMNSSTQHTRAYDTERSLIELRTTLSDAESSQRAYLLSARAEDAGAFERAGQRWTEAFTRLREAIARERDATTAAGDVERLGTLGRNALIEMRASLSSRDPASSGDPARPAREFAERLIQQQDARIESLREEVLHDTRITMAIAVLTTVLTIAVLLALHRLLKRYIAARIQAEEALRRANQQLNAQVEERTAELSELSQHLIRASEEEKARIARELHDTLGSNLTAINMDLNWISKRLPDQPELKERLQRALQLLTDTVELKHEVIEGLRPSHLDNLGLGFAMRTHCREFTQRSGVPCHVSVDEDFDDLDPGWSIALYRVVQESLTNVTRHAQAQSVQVQLFREDEGIRLRVVDDGDGIPAGATTRPSSHGLVGMRERMRQVGGTVRFLRGPSDRGTVVEAFVPFAAITARAV